MRRINFRSSAVLTIFALLAVAAACAPQESSSHKNLPPQNQFPRKCLTVAQIPRLRKTCTIDVDSGRFRQARSSSPMLAMAAAASSLPSRRVAFGY